MKEFSVLISVYAREQSDYLRSALHSVFEQTVPPTEVVLVEDGPLTTELEAVITDFCEKYNTLKIVKLAKNMGLGNALNIGLSACTYDLVARMDSDDLSLPNRFEAQLKVFEENPEVSVVGGWISEFDNDPQSIISYRKLPQTDRELRRMCQLKNPLNHMTVMFSKKEVLDAGGYQHFYLFEDYYLWARMLLLGVEARNLPDTLLYMRAGTGMYKRRGGWKYVKSMLHFRLFLWKSGLSSFLDFVVCAGGQMMICLIPNRLRELFYKKFLRK